MQKTFLCYSFEDIFVLPRFPLGFSSVEATDEMRFETDGRSAAFPWSKQVLPNDSMGYTGLSLPHLPLGFLYFSELNFSLTLMA